MAFNLYIQGDEGGYLPVESIPPGYSGPVFNGVWNGEDYNLVPIDPAIVSDPALQYGQQGSVEYQLATLGRLGGGLSNPSSVAQYLKAVAPNFDWSNAIQNAYNQQVSQFGSGFVSGADDPAQTAIKIIQASNQPWAGQAEQYIRFTPQFAQSQAMGAASQQYAQQQNEGYTFGIPNEAIGVALGAAGGPLGLMGLSTGTPVLDTIINQAITQGITTGNIDPESLVKTGVLGVAAPEFTNILKDAGLSPEVANILTKTATGAISSGLSGALMGAATGAAKQFGGPTLPQEQGDYPIQDMGPMPISPVAEAPVLTQPLQFASGYGGTSDVVPIVDQKNEPDALIVRPTDTAGEEVSDQSITTLLSLNPGSETTPSGPNAALLGDALSGGGSSIANAPKFSIFGIAPDTYSIKDISNDKVYTLVNFGGDAKLIDNSTRLYVDLAPDEIQAINNIVNQANESNLVKPADQAAQELPAADIAIATENAAIPPVEPAAPTDVAAGTQPVTTEETAATAAPEPVTTEQTDVASAPAPVEEPTVTPTPDQTAMDKAVMDLIKTSTEVPRETTVIGEAGTVAPTPETQVIPQETGGMQTLPTGPDAPEAPTPIGQQVIPVEYPQFQTAPEAPAAPEKLVAFTPETDITVQTQPQPDTGTATGPTQDMTAPPTGGDITGPITGETPQSDQEKAIIDLIFGGTTPGGPTDTGTPPTGIVDISTAPVDTSVPGIMTPGTGGEEVITPSRDVTPPGGGEITPTTDVVPPAGETVPPVVTPPTEVVEPPPTEEPPPAQELPPPTTVTFPEEQGDYPISETTAEPPPDQTPPPEKKGIPPDLQRIFDLGLPISGTRYASLFERGQSGTAPAGTPGRAGAGELDPTRTGKKRQNVWNVSSLKNLQDALGI